MTIAIIDLFEMIEIEQNCSGPPTAIKRHSVAFECDTFDRSTIGKTRQWIGGGGMLQFFDTSLDFPAVQLFGNCNVQYTLDALSQLGWDHSFAFIDEVDGPRSNTLNNNVLPVAGGKDDDRTFRSSSEDFWDQFRSFEVAKIVVHQAKVKVARDRAQALGTGRSHADVRIGHHLLQ